MRIRYTEGVYLLDGYTCRRHPVPTQRKLWRHLKDTRLLCTAHLAEETAARLSDFTREGCYLDSWGVSDTVAGWFPAVPSDMTDQGDVTAYWDYASIPNDGRRWWQNWPL